ncbi:UbiD family decarboxylase [Subtercola frigoramans]|uniref:4-hydroxy-3-polyprenylbenzoate decarboxylase n=1 Tax=Subtercola frigoramans TaxID=120298 RepID=A0ABS2L8Q2_9MICO|nr:UbiD family decarboxylase [Subtercola frigoramans]MBM7473472.1 4-hydroxy-3-polyprenylbenzoate decarboxylase [Subtercola frigoramans]
MAPIDQSLRSFLKRCDDRGLLKRVFDTVSPEFEIAAYLAELDPGPVVTFDSVAGSTMPVVANVLGSLERIADALGTDVSGIQSAITEAVGSTGRLELVDVAPVQQKILGTDLSALPIPTFFEREGGPYITAGVIIARDPVTGLGNASFARVRPLGGNRAMIGIAPNHHLNKMAERAPDGRLEIAVVIGAHPSVQLAACLYLGLGDDELLHVESMLGEPLRVVQARTVDLLVPADAEIVLEGVLDVRNTFDEGDVSEYHGMYERYGAAATAEFSAITSRADPIYQAVLPGLHREHLYLGAIPIAAGLRAAVERSIPNVGEVSITESGGGRLVAVVQLHDPRPGQGKQAMMACWGSLSMLKQVTVVNDDIDVWDPIAVEWARIARCRIERDLVTIQDARTDRSEPLESGGTVTKIGFDALVNESDRVEGFERATPPAAVTTAVREKLFGLPNARQTRSADEGVTE